MAISNRGVAVVTGASSGIGLATARSLVHHGYSVVLGARRTDRLTEIVNELGPAARFAQLDVSDGNSVSRFCEAVETCNLLVQNAGFAGETAALMDVDEEVWLKTHETNVLGALRVTRALLPKLIASGDGYVISVGSLSIQRPREKRAGYIAAKSALQALMDVLRLELADSPVRVSQVHPGTTKTEFPLGRLGDEARVASFYATVDALDPSDVADCIAFLATRPTHVAIDELIVRPRSQ